MSVVKGAVSSAMTVGWRPGVSWRNRLFVASDRRSGCRQTFRNIERTLGEAGATLSDMVTMTVFLIDARYTTSMTEIRSEIFKNDFAASAAITVAGFADPNIMIEIQGVAVPA
jgi:2-iminobutanoate/2-iminopropanoate deaminase